MKVFYRGEGREMLMLMVLLALLTGGRSQQKWTSRPNIIVFMVDDLGYGDLTPYGHPTSFTPNIAKMAQEGLVFTQFYATSPVGSPSRASFLTGRYPSRTGVYPGIFRPDDLGGLPSNEITIAEKLRSVGYSTGMVGKWQLGVGENGQHLPNSHGFDYYMGLPYSHSDCPCYYCFFPSQRCNQHCDPEFVPCPIYVGNKYHQMIVQQPANLVDLSDNLLNSALSFIEKKSALRIPFFLYYAFPHTHGPQFSGHTFRNSSSRGPFGDSLREVDHAVGMIMQALKNKSIDSDTFIFLTSDNGPDLSLKQEGGSAGPLRCGKGSTWEGGVRVPAIAWWPGTVPRNRTHQLISMVDLFPTLVKMTKGKVPQNRKIDGIEMTKVLFEEGGKTERDWLPLFPAGMNVSEGPHAIRYKSYKAHFYTKGGQSPDDYYDQACRRSTSTKFHNPPLLFNVNSDPGEKHPLNAEDYSSMAGKIGLIKQKLMYSLEWAEPQTKLGRDKDVQPCASPGCSPFPYCCSVDSLTHTQPTDFL